MDARDHRVRPGLRRGLVDRPEVERPEGAAAVSAPSLATRSRWLLAGVILTAALSAITGIVSYQHGLYVARLTRNTGLVAYLVPLVPDLMIAMSSVTLIEAARFSRRPPTAMVALVAGVGWTVAQNIAGGWQGGTGGRLIAAGIPLALVAAFESLLWLLRNARRADGQPPAGRVQPDEPLSTEAALRVLLASDSQRQLAAVLKVDRSRVQAWARQVAEPAEAVPPEMPAETPNGAPHDA